MDRWSRLKANLAFGVAFAIFAALLVRLYDLQVTRHAAYAATSERQGRAICDLRSPRALILTKDEQILAISVARPSIAIDPTKVPNHAVATAGLSQALGFDPAVVAALLNRVSENGQVVRFVWLKRFASDAELAAAMALKLPGLLVMTEYDRVYPHEKLLGPVVGIVNSDDVGCEGLEGRREFRLRGAQIRTTVMVDAKRKLLERPEQPVDGEDVVLTVDSRFQAILEQELDVAVDKYHPRWAAVVAMDPRTGAILGMASRPTFDPNEPAPRDLTTVEAAKFRRNLAIAAPYEPGSTFKPFVVAWALEKKLLTPETVFDCENGTWKFGPRTLHDHHAYGMLPVTEIVSRSSNIGAIKIGATVLGKDRLHDAVLAFGFGVRSGIDLPAEEPGIMTAWPRWSVYTITSVPMGHEIAVTPLQLAAGMSVFANGGRLMKPYIVATVGGKAAGQPTVVRQILSTRTCEQMKAILAQVMKSGTGKEIQVDGVTLAGKTGTTEKLDRRGNRYGYISSFVGFAPVENPKVVIAVVVDEPQGAHYGSAVAAPVFGAVVRRGWVYLPVRE